MFQEHDDEAAVLDDIRYFEMRIALLEENGEHNAATVQVHRLLLRQRRQLLAAIRDGAPERWREYAQVPDDSNIGAKAAPVTDDRSAAQRDS